MSIELLSRDQMQGDQPSQAPGTLLHLEVHPRIHFGISDRVAPIATGICGHFPAVVSPSNRLKHIGLSAGMTIAHFLLANLN